MSLIRAEFCLKLDQFDLYADLTIPSSGITAIFGPSGCGKTTLLRCMAGLDRCDEGYFSINDTIWQDNKSFTLPHKRAIGYVFQEASLFPHLSVKQNLLYGQKRSKSTMALDEITQLLGLTDLLKRSTAKLSGGERQRVAIARALLCDPAILLMDEPLSALDRFSKEEILPYLDKLQKDLSIPIVYVTHDFSEIERLANQLIYMERGLVKAQGPLGELISNPALPLSTSPQAASVFDGKVVDIDAEYGLATLRVKGADIIVSKNYTELGSIHRFKVAAKDVGLCRNRATEGSSIINGPPARIIRIEQAGPFKMNILMKLGAEGDGEPLIARITRKSFDTLALKEGEQVHALIKGVALNGSDPSFTYPRED
ncbi:MAG: molybdenum ABC transporter ATP-binding protein [Methylocystaceae bacterium]|nr:molybdenum ABC transporter ATP-binding protein [Methylocystaceae bacterium]